MSNYSVKRILVGQLEKGADLHNSITRVIQENSIRAGRVTGMGAVQRAKLAYYDQRSMKYSEIELTGPMEIVSMYGNVSIRDGKPFAHVHVVLSDEKGNGKGGHLLPGETPIFACEIMIEEFDGPELVRTFDERTGLALWKKEENL